MEVSVEDGKKERFRPFTVNFHIENMKDAEDLYKITKENKSISGILHNAIVNGMIENDINSTCIERWDEKYKANRH